MQNLKMFLFTFFFASTQKFHTKNGYNEPLKHENSSKVSEMISCEEFFGYLSVSLEERLEH